MKILKNWKEIEKGDKVMFKPKKKGYSVWFGSILENKFGERLLRIQTTDGRLYEPKDSFIESWFEDNKIWQMFKLTEEEFEKCELKIIEGKL